jgi:hypothetical protein
MAGTVMPESATPAPSAAADTRMADLAGVSLVGVNLVMLRTGMVILVAAPNADSTMAVTASVTTADTVTRMTTGPRGTDEPVAFRLLRGAGRLRRAQSSRLPAPLGRRKRSLAHLTGTAHVW